MKTIRFTDKNKDKAEEGFRIAVNAATLKSTAHRGIYEVPNYVVTLLAEKEISYEEVNIDSLER